MNYTRINDPTAHIAIRNIEKEQKGMEVFRGDIFYVSQSKNISGSEQDGKRPAIIVSNNTGNHFSDCVEVVYLTSAEKKPLPTHVPIVCQCMSTALCEAVCTVSKTRLETFVRTCNKQEMKEIDAALRISLALDETTLPNNESFSEFASDSHGKNDATDNSDIILEQKEEIIKATAERDLYKKLYEQMLEKLVG